MKKDPIAILFGSDARVKLLRFFLFNPKTNFEFDEVSRRARLVRRTARTEMNALERAGVIKKKSFTKENEQGKKVKVSGYAFNEKFPEFQALQTFLFETLPMDNKTLLKHLRKAGVLDFVAVTGIFVRDFENRLDVLMVMKSLPEKKIENAIRSLESELGIEVRFAAITSDDLLYRMSMSDKLTRDVFDYPHKVLVDRLNIGETFRSR